MIPKPDKEVRQKQAINQGREGGKEEGRQAGRKEMADQFS